MYCMQCGTLLSPDTKFCAKCGSPVNKVSFEKSTEALIVPAVVTKPNVLWVYVIAVAIVGTYAAMFIPAFVGQTINPQSGYGAMLWTGLFFHLWWKRRGRKGWHGALNGAAIGLLVFFAASFLSGFMRHGAGG